MEKTTYIIPVHEYNETVETYLDRALKSLTPFKGKDGSKLIFVGPADITAKCLERAKKVKLTLECDTMETDEKDLFAKLNLAVNSCVTPYFSILEFDDEYLPYWDEIAQNTIKNNPDYSVILPIIELESGTEEKKKYGLLNEIAWDASFADTLGHLGIEELQIFKDFNVTGAYIKTEDFITAGGHKPSMKIAAWYELLLRMIDKGYTIFVAPRVGYRHTVKREGSYMMEMGKTIKQEEGMWLIEYALRDYKNKQDAGEIYKEPENKDRDKTNGE